VVTWHIGSIGSLRDGAFETKLAGLRAVRAVGVRVGAPHPAAKAIGLIANWEAALRARTGRYAYFISDWMNLSSRSICRSAAMR
jgi:hypothetical protein